MAGEREGENYRSVASHMHPTQGPNPQPRHVPRPGIKPAAFHSVGQCPTNRATPVRALPNFK